MTSKVHIVHVIHRFDTGGLENGVVNLINRLTETDYQHTIVTMKGHNPEFAARITTNNVEFADLSKKDGNDFSVFAKLNKLLKRLKPDVLHTRNTATLEMQLVGWWRRVPLRIHGEHGWDVNDMHGQNVRYQRLRRAFRPFVHQYIALSVEARDYLLNVIKVKPKKVNHICNGVDDSKFTVFQKTEDKPFVFGCVGRLEDVKNHVLLAEAFAIVNKQSDAKLHLIGEGGCRSKVEGIFSRENCQKNVWMAGNRSDVPSLMQGFDAFILPSLAEGISNTILEAMSSGLPVIATNVGGNSELVVDDESGYLVASDNPQQMADKMLIYVNDNKLANQHGANGRKRVEQKFSIRAMTTSYDKLYRSSQ
jgi:sugar transferase (PEP-CTERM/EpsH1 system associated)